MGMLDIGKYWDVLQDKKKWDRAKHRLNPRRKPAPETGR